MKPYSESHHIVQRPKTADRSVQEKSEGHESTLLSQLVEKEFLGTSEKPGLFQEIDQLTTAAERDQVIQKLGHLVSRCGLLVLAGYSDVSATCVQAIQSAAMRFQQRQEKLHKEGITLPSISETMPILATRVLETVFRISSIHPEVGAALSSIINSFTASDYTRLQSPPFLEKFNLMAHFALKTGLRNTLIQQGLTHLQEETGIFAIEKNILIKAFSSEYEQTLFPTLNWDDATRTRLTDEYIALAGTFDEEALERSGGLVEEVLKFQKASGSDEDRDTLSPAYKQYINALAQFEKRWINFELELSRIPRTAKTG